MTGFSSSFISRALHLCIVSFSIVIFWGCSSSPQDGSVIVGSAKHNQAPTIRLVTIIPSPLTLAQPITAHVAADDPDGADLTTRFQWIVNDVPLFGATGVELKPEHVKRGDQVALEVIVSDGQTDSAPFRTEPITVVNTPPLVGQVTIETDLPQESNRVYARVNAFDSDHDELHYSYRWWRNDKQVKDGEENFLDTAGFGRKDMVALEVIVRDLDTAGMPVRATPVVLGNSPPQILSSPAVLTNKEQYEYAVRAKDPDGDGINYGLETAPPGMAIDRGTGQITWKLTPVSAGTHRVKVMVDDGQGGMAWQDFEISIPSPAPSSASQPPSQG
ncbi:MAG: hypothetical protein K0S45_849 [Nitrospira sp.]|nr:hypothetical protein [Nitrospira sp.]